MVLVRMPRNSGAVTVARHGIRTRPWVEHPSQCIAAGRPTQICVQGHAGSTGHRRGIARRADVDKLVQHHGGERFGGHRQLRTCRTKHLEFIRARRLIHGGVHERERGKVEVNGGSRVGAAIDETATSRRLSAVT